MPDSFGIVATAIAPLDEANEFLFDEGKTPTPTPTPKPTPKPEEKKKEEEEVKSPTQDEIFGETEETEEKEEEKEDEPDEDNQFIAMSKSLYDLGIFEADEDDEGNPLMVTASNGEEMKSLWEEQKAKALDSSLYNYLMNKHGEEGVRIFSAIFRDGTDPREYYKTYTEMEDIASLSLESVENQETVVREALKTQGFSPEAINRKIQKLKTNAELEDEANEWQPILVKKKQEDLSKQQQLAAQREQNKIAAVQEYRENINRVLSSAIKEKELDGIPLTAQKAQEVANYMYKITRKSADGREFSEFDIFLAELKKPENLKTAIKIAILKNNDMDVSSIQKRGITKESKTLFQELAQKKKSSKAPSQQIRTSTGGVIEPFPI